MSFTAQLIIEGTTFDVREFSWTISQQTDTLGRPGARVHGGTVELTLDAQPSELLHSWALDDTKRLGGVINVFEADRYTIRNHLDFYGAYCVGLDKQFQDVHATHGMTMHLSLSANRLVYAEMTLDNAWPD